MVDDISKKLDEVLNIGSSKKPKGVSSKSVNNSDEKSAQSESVSVAVKKNNLKNKESDSKTDISNDNVKVRNNILTYFKTRYTQNPSIFSDILDESHVETIFAEHKIEIEAKKEGNERNKFKTSILYKNIIQNNKKMREKLQAKMMDEIDSSSINNDADVEKANNSS